MNADIIIAVDMASEDDTRPVCYGDSVSGCIAAEIQSRLAYVSCASELEEPKEADGALYVILLVQDWVPRNWASSWILCSALQDGDEGAPRGKEVKGSRGRRNGI
ncbi:hypothetical protein BJV82DRAFT_669209 [Fennellomyces sp. T-0311]|nr:hypothetical protein BJV82DRAFT_669209 [Fennellomyces sp. T-0311]